VRTKWPEASNQQPKTYLRSGWKLGAKRSGSWELSTSCPGVGFELQHQRFRPVSLDNAQVPDQHKRESSRSDSDALYPAVTRRL